MEEQKQEQLSSATQDNKSHYHISPNMGKLILLAVVLSVLIWFLSELLKVNILNTFFNIFFIVLGAAPGILKFFPKSEKQGTGRSNTTHSTIKPTLTKITQKLTPHPLLRE